MTASRTLHQIVNVTRAGAPAQIISDIVAEVAALTAPTKPVVYLCHPVSGDVEANLAATRVWIKWLVDRTTWAVSAPWVAYVEALAEAGYRERGLADDLALVERHTLVIAVGDRCSEGMSVELDHAVACGIPVINVTGLGYKLPPTTPYEEERLLSILRMLAPAGTVVEASPLAVQL